jgi:hypothetical protein
MNKKIQIADFIQDCDEKCKKTRQYSQYLKIINILCSIFIIIGGVIVTAQGFLDPDINYLQVFTGISISTIKTIVSAFSLRERGIVYKTISVKFRRLSRKLVNLQLLNASETDINNTLSRAYQEFDDLDITLYNQENINVNKNSPV